MLILSTTSYNVTWSLLECVVFLFVSNYVVNKLGLKLREANPYNKTFIWILICQYGKFSLEQYVYGLEVECKGLTLV